MYFAFFFKSEILFENHILYEKVISINNYSTRARSVADPNLQIRGGAGVIQTLRKGVGLVSKKKIFGLLLAPVWSTNKGGPSPGSATGVGYEIVDSQRRA